MSGKGRQGGRGDGVLSSGLMMDEFPQTRQQTIYADSPNESGFSVAPLQLSLPGSQSPSSKRASDPYSLPYSLRCRKFTSNLPLLVISRPFLTECW